MSQSTLQQLQMQPQDFDFFQAVRLLEWSSRFDIDQSEYEPSTPAINFSTSPSLRYHPTELVTVEANLQEKRPTFTLQINGFSIFGSEGVLPYHYTEEVLKQLRQKNRALIEYLDLFNDRSVSLLYRAWEKYRFQIGVGKSRRAQHQSSSSKPKKRDLFTEALDSFCGISEKVEQKQSKVTTAIRSFAGLFSRRVVSPIDLERALSHYFEATIKIEQFKGQWLELPNDFTTQLPCEESPSGRNNQLGGKNVEYGAMLGSKCWQVQNRIKLVVECENLHQFNLFSPDSETLDTLSGILNYALGDEISVDLVLRIEPSLMPTPTLGKTELRHSKTDRQRTTTSTTASVNRLGFNTLLSAPSVANSEKSSNKMSYLTIPVRMPEPETLSFV